MNEKLFFEGLSDEVYLINVNRNIAFDKCNIGLTLKKARLHIA